MVCVNHHVAYVTLRQQLMNSIDFCFWLQGYFEINGESKVSDEQAEIIKNHLNLVFKHEIDPLRESETDTPVSVLNDTHKPSKPFPFHNDPLVRC